MNKIKLEKRPAQKCKDGHGYYCLDDENNMCFFECLDDCDFIGCIKENVVYVEINDDTICG